jgi:hypothetical protein
MLPLRIEPYLLSVVKLSPHESYAWAETSRFFSITRSDDELSVVCETALVPPGRAHHQPSWRALKINTMLDFSMVGVLAGISGILAKAGVSIFVVSTFNTDYILVKEDLLSTASAVLRKEAYDIAA